MDAYVIHTLAAGINGSLPRIIYDKKKLFFFKLSTDYYR